MLPLRSPIQTAKTLNPIDEKVFSTYQDEYNSGRTHGNLVAHYGNSAYLNRQPVIQAKQFPKPFISASFHNLNSTSYMCNKLSDNYSNNYLTSDDSVLKRPIHTAPSRTKLDQFYNIKTAPVAQPDTASIYEQEYLNKRVNDHFVSKKWIKPETLNLRDNVSVLMEIADFFRNKSYDINMRNLFGKDANGFNHLDTCGQLFSNLSLHLEYILLAYNRMNLNAIELKKMTENFRFAQSIIDRNLWDRKLKPNFEKSDYMSTETSIKKDNELFAQERDQNNRLLKETHNLLNAIENYIHQNMEEVFEEARVILMHKMHNKEYERRYLRDSNGYIKGNAKLPMDIEAWFELANKSIKRLQELKKKADTQNEIIIKRINNVGENISNQWIDTHDKASNQVEAGLKIQSKLIDTQYDLNREIDQLTQLINETKLKLGTAEMLDEVYLNQLKAILSKIDPYYNEHRKGQQQLANNIWANATDLRDNLNKMIQYKKELLDRKQRLDKNIFSNHTGLNYDLKTIVSPRRNTVGCHPSVGLVNKSIGAFL